MHRQEKPKVEWMIGLGCVLLVIGISHETADCQSRDGQAKDNKAKVQKFIKDLDIRDGGVRRDAMWGLKDFAPDAKAAIPKLAKLLESEGSDAFYAAQTLAYMGKAAKEAVPALGKIIQDQDRSSSTRVEAAFALGSIGQNARTSVPALIAALRDKHAEVRAYAAKSLGWWGQDAKSAIPALKRALEDDGESIVRGKKTKTSFTNGAYA